MQEAWLRLERTGRGVDRRPRRLADHRRRPARARRAALRPRAARAYVGPWLPEPIAVLRRGGPGRPRHARRVGQLRAAGAARAALARRAHGVRAARRVRRAVRRGRARSSAARRKRCASSPRAPAATSRSSARASRPRATSTSAPCGRSRDAVGEGDLDGLVAVLDPDVVWTSDGGGRAIAARKPLHGADARRARLGRDAPHEAIAPAPTPIELNGRLGLLIAGRDGHRSVSPSWSTAAASPASTSSATRTSCAALPRPARLPDRSRPSASCQSSIVIRSMRSPRNS